MKIEVRNLNYRVGNHQILKDVNAVFEGNQLYGIIGPNGCGKTTLLRHLYRKLPSQNHVFLDGKDIQSYSRRLYARKIAVMMQHQDFAENELTVKSVVQMGRFPYKKMLVPYGREDDEIVEQVLRETDLIELGDRKINTLSGGELQRVMLAKCFAQEPEAILLDEPTNHLDVRYKVELMTALKSFQGLVVMTIHDLNLAAKYCDRVLVMKSGQIKEQGIPSEVLGGDLLEEVFQVKIGTMQKGGRVWLDI